MVALILERLPVTLELTVLAVAFALLLGDTAGILSAVRRDQAIDNVTRVGTLLGLSVPVFWQGTMLILFFSLYLRWMPPVMWVDFFADPRRNLTIMLLPALCLGHRERGQHRAHHARVHARRAPLGVHPHRRGQGAGRPRSSSSSTPCKNALIPVVTVAGPADRHPARRHRGRRGGVHPARHRPPGAVVDLPARLSR